MSDKFRSRQTIQNPATAHSTRQRRQQNEESCRKDQRICAKEDYETNKTKNNHPLL